MADIVIRPDMRTSGGEVSDILLDQQYAGSITLVYREGTRIAGSVQLEREILTQQKKKAVLEHVHHYVESLIEAIEAKECDVIVTYSRFHHIIATDTNVGVIDSFVDSDGKDEVVQVLDCEREEQEEKSADPEDVDEPPEQFAKLSSKSDKHKASSAEGERDSTFYELVVVNEYGTTTVYHIYNFRRKWVAEAVMSIYDHEVIGEVDWRHEPDEEEMKRMTDLLISDFNEDQIDRIVIDMKYNGLVLETEELTHKDLLDEKHIEYDNPYSVVLAREDQETLTYHIYRQTEGGWPIGTATIDIRRPHVTGYIELRNRGSESDRETIASLLMAELDKEIEYRSFNVTIFYQNQPIDEIQFENQTAH